MHMRALIFVRLMAPYGIKVWHIVSFMPLRPPNPPLFCIYSVKTWKNTWPPKAPEGKHIPPNVKTLPFGGPVNITPNVLYLEGGFSRNPTWHFILMFTMWGLILNESLDWGVSQLQFCVCLGGVTHQCLLAVGVVFSWLSSHQNSFFF